MVTAKPTVAVLGASGLIGTAIALQLQAAGYPILAVARQFTASQQSAFGPAAIVSPLAAATPTDLARLIASAALVVNCIGVLQDSARGSTAEIHSGFVARLLAALKSLERPTLLVHLSVPGDRQGDSTAFSRTKRDGEELIAASGTPYAILRPGFVIAPAAFGGSALLCGLIAWPIDMPAANRRVPFRATAVADIGRTVIELAERWSAGERHWSANWDLMAREPLTLGTVLDTLRRHFGGPPPRLRLPGWLLAFGSTAGDLVSRLGWSPPLRSTALAELRRGVSGDPEPWIAATGIVPITLDAALAATPATVEELWFSRLFLLKPIILATLVSFWCLSGAIALFAAFAPPPRSSPATASPCGWRKALLLSAACSISASAS